jgi:cell division protein FtsZ
MEVKPNIETFAKIKVVGVGGSGGAAISRMIHSKIRGVDFIAINTDAQDLHHTPAPKKLHIGKTVTKGLGAGMDPELGKKSAEEAQSEIHDALKGADMIFISCGMGGGTGTGASPIVAQVARDLGALTIAVVTKPFSFEGAQRESIAEKGVEELTDKVDTIIVIPNDRILQIVDKKTSLIEAFKTVDEVLRQGVQGISDIITVPGLINVDFADVKAIMKDAGSSLMGIGKGKGENRAQTAAKQAIDSPLLEISVDGARGILFTVSGPRNLGMYEVDEAAKIITESADPNAKIIFGAVIDENLKDEVKITVIATGFEKEKRLGLGLPSWPGLSLDKVKEKPSFFEKKEETRPKSHFWLRKSKADEFSSMGSKEDREEEKGKEEEELEVPAFIRKKMM